MDRGPVAGTGNENEGGDETEVDGLGRRTRASLP
jgi:hypothetical protein